MHPFMQCTHVTDVTSIVREPVGVSVGFSQERAASGWNQWHRKSNLAQIILPHQIGIDLAIVDRDTGAAYRYGLLTPQFHSAVPVRMGMHAYDGSYSALSVVPFPTTTTRANVSVQSAVVNGTSQVRGCGHAWV